MAEPISSPHSSRTRALEEEAADEAEVTITIRKRKPLTPRGPTSPRRPRAPPPEEDEELLPAEPEPVLPPPLPVPRIRCPLHDAIMQRETGLWRTSALVAASVPLMRFLRLRAEIKPVTHRIYNAAFSQPEGGVLAAAGGQGRITVYPTLSLSSYNQRDPSTQILRPHVSFTGTHRHAHAYACAHMLALTPGPTLNRQMLRTLSSLTSLSHSAR